MFTIIAVGFVVGFLVSLPLGPMAMQAAILWSFRRFRNAAFIALGVCAGDFVVGLAVVIMLRLYGQEFHVPAEWGGLVLMILSISIYLGADKPFKPQDLMTGLQYFGKGMLLTVIHPGNVLTYAWIYGSVANWPSIGMKTVQGMAWYEAGLLLVANTGGMVAGWYVFIRILNWRERRYGEVSLDWRPKLAYGVSMVTMCVAEMVYFDIQPIHMFF